MAAQYLLLDHFVVPLVALNHPVKMEDTMVAQGAALYELMILASQLIQMLVSAAQYPFRLGPEVVVLLMHFLSKM